MIPRGAGKSIGRRRKFVTRYIQILADEAKTAQFLADKGEALTPAAMELFLDAVLQEFLEATDLLKRRAAGIAPPITTYKRWCAR